MMRVANVFAVVTVFALVAIDGSSSPHCAELQREQPVETEMREIAQNLRCPVCQGQSVYDSNADLAQQMKQTIREKLNAGETPSQIVAFFKARYGNYVLMAPPRGGLHWGIWLGPFVLVLIGGGLVVWRVLRSRQQIIAVAGHSAHDDMERLEL